jgi:Tol biopolymer transport system component
MDVDGNNRRRVGYHAEGMPFPLFQGFHWSPDSKKIAYSVFNMSTNDYENFTDIFIIDVDKGGLTNLSNSPYVVDTNPAWSPDGSKIAYFSISLDEGSFTWIMDADGKNKTKLYQTGGRSSWTPDGKGLIFTNRLNVYEIMEMDTHGDNLASLVKTEDIRISEPVWIGQ